MEKIEARKKNALNTLTKLKTDHNVSLKKPAAMSDFISFAKCLKEVFAQGDAITKEKIIKRLIHKIEVNPDEVTLHLIVDQNYYPKGASDGPHVFVCPKSKVVRIKGLPKDMRPKTKKAPRLEGLEALQMYLNHCVSYFSSNSLTFGARGQT